jgi:glutamate N-acetyltransferase/amino-acid N-acetyltransferase
MINSRHVKIIRNGTVTSPLGFMAGAVHAGIKQNQQLDLGIIFSKQKCVASGVFTTNFIQASPVILTKKHIEGKTAQAIVVNSGCANACTGKAGLSDALIMVNTVAYKFNISINNVLVASTGVIGVRLPIDKIKNGITRLKVSKRYGKDFAQAIMTTDTFIKQIALSVNYDDFKFNLAGVVKGAGMVHPNMATMLGFITTDANIESEFLQKSLIRAVNSTFNMITVDGDTSTNDMVIILANGMAQNKIINNSNGRIFQQALNYLCQYLAESLARDGEGATKLIEVSVEGAISLSDARIAARTIAGSPLVKTAIYGNDPNWGRIAAALGRSGARLKETKLDIYLNNYNVFKQGYPQLFNSNELSQNIKNIKDKIIIRINLNLGKYKAKAWGCDLSEEYVTINSAYTT